MYRPKRWKIEPPNPAAEELASRLKVSVLVAQSLLNRGVASADEAQLFMRPSLKTLHDPALIPGLTAAAQRIAKAVRDGEKIVIYGDYDVDGITATCILWHALKLLGANAESYIPHRLEEGYGLNSEAIGQIIDAGAKLIITVDCGITAVEQARLARDRGVDLIVTDHHEWHEDAITHAPSLPVCAGIVHPRLPGHAAYPNPFLCGAGVAFKLAWGIGQAINGAARVSDSFREFLIEATALAALGTIADVVPLVGENRVLAHYGLGGLKESKLTGIRALIASAALTGQKLDSYHVGFLLAPRLNACGRMGHARLAVEMLTVANEARATEIAQFLEEQNRARQAVEREILEQALAQIQANHWDEDSNRALVLGAEGWHAGVIGIVASRIVDRLSRPTIMIALTNGHGQGSARSVPGFHLAHALEKCGSYLLSYGGHEMAAGLKMETARLADFRRAFCDYAAETITPQMLSPELNLESITELAQISESLVTDLRRLGPFGHGNRKPLFALRNMTVAALPRRVGKTGEHLQMMLRQEQRTMKCIAFKTAELLERLGTGTVIDVAVEPCINEFNGRRSVELEIKDIQFAAP